MKYLVFKCLILIIPVSLGLFFYLFLIEENNYPGADYEKFELPVFELQNLDANKLIKKDSLKGDLIINVWASWCITCLIEHPYLMNLKSNGIEIIGLNYKDEKNDASEWLRRYGNPYKIIIHDYKGSLALDLGVTGAPETFLVDDGEIVAHYQGEINRLIWEDVFVPVIEERNMFSE